MENEGLDKVNYLIGAVYRRADGPPNFVPFFAESPDEVEANLLEFLRWAKTLEDPVFYHWHVYEKTQLNKMVEHYGIGSDLANVVMDNMVDLSPAATKTFAFPCYGQTLKDVAKSLGFSWRQDDVTGVGSMALYWQYLDSGGLNVEARRKIVIYNEDDCRATMHIFDSVALCPRSIGHDPRKFSHQSRPVLRCGRGNGARALTRQRPRVGLQNLPCRVRPAPLTEP